MAILGGAKVADKIQLISNLIDKADEIIIGGGMAYTFLKVLNQHGDRHVASRSKRAPRSSPEVMAKAKAKGVPIHLPVDFVAADKFDPNANTKVVTAKEGIPAGWQGLDCGPETIKQFAQVIARAKTIIWNGPLGVFEIRQIRRRHARRHGCRGRSHATRCRHRHRRRRHRHGGREVGHRQTKSPIAPPAAAPRSNFSKARSCRASRRCRMREQIGVSRDVAAKRHTAGLRMRARLATAWSSRFLLTHRGKFG